MKQHFQVEVLQSWMEANSEFETVTFPQEPTPSSKEQPWKPMPSLVDIFPCLYSLMQSQLLQTIGRKIVEIILWFPSIYKGLMNK
jgi:hypothetical protein